jgi:alkylhydroperoxidase family enzyme
LHAAPVHNLRRENVEVAKLLALKKDDSALTARERAAVAFARKLTARPDSVTDADRRALLEAWAAASRRGPRSFCKRARLPL